MLHILMLKRPHYIALGLVLMLTLTILGLPGHTVARLKLGIGNFFLPLFGLASSSQRMLEKASDAALSRSELSRQNEVLRQENHQLKLQLNQAEKASQENDHLRKLLGWQQRSRLKLKPGRVILSDPANWWRTVQIDLGSRDGISNALPVLNPDGFLVGRISQVSLTRSQVLLLGDPNCKVAVKVENPTRDTGVISASGPLESGVVEMGFLSRNANLKPGQLVRTSGKGGVFPENIDIGNVIDSHSIEAGLSTVARVRLAADLGTLDEVWVKFP
jgi:rod shape-determining protein MreC